MQGAAKVGGLVVLFAILVSGAYQVLGKSMFRNPTNNYKILFADASGVAEGTKVLMAGVPIGAVSKVRLAAPSTAEVTVEIDKAVMIPSGSSAVLPTSLIGFGDNPIQIVPSGAGMLAPGSQMSGVRTSALEQMLPNTKETMLEVNKTLVATRELISDQSLKENLKNVMKSVDTTLTQFGDLAKRMDGLMASNQGRIQQAISNATEAMAEVKLTVASVRKLASDPIWRDKTAGLLDALTSTTKKADGLVAELSSFVGDKQMKQSILDTLDNTSKITATGTKIAANTEEITKNGVTISAKAIELTDKANLIIDDMRKLIEKVGGVFNKGGGKSPLAGIEANMDLIRESKPNHWRTDSEVSLPFGDQRVHLGLFDMFESNKITLQLSQPLGNKGRYRYGIYASKPGVGVEYRLAPRLSLRGDMFDINNPRADLRARYEFGNGFYGYLGVERLFDRNAAMLGIGIRK